MPKKINISFDTSHLRYQEDIEKWVREQINEIKINTGFWDTKFAPRQVYEYVERVTSRGIDALVWAVAIATDENEKQRDASKVKYLTHLQEKYKKEIIEIIHTAMFYLEKLSDAVSILDRRVLTSAQYPLRRITDEKHDMVTLLDMVNKSPDIRTVEEVEEIEVRDKFLRYLEEKTTLDFSIPKGYIAATPDLQYFIREKWEEIRKASGRYDKKYDITSINGAYNKEHRTPEGSSMSMLLSEAKRRLRHLNLTTIRLDNGEYSKTDTLPTYYKFVIKQYIKFSADIAKVIQFEKSQQRRLSTEINRARGAGMFPDSVGLKDIYRRATEKDANQRKFGDFLDLELGKAGGAELGDNIHDMQQFEEVKRSYIRNNGKFI